VNAKVRRRLRRLEARVAALEGVAWLAATNVVVDLEPHRPPVEGPLYDALPVVAEEEEWWRGRYV
jgi:hypothetical protein